MQTPVIAATIEHPDVSIDRVIVKTPSEHKLDGETLGMELQFMHKAASVRSRPSLSLTHH